MTSERVIKEAPVPVRYRWSRLSGAPMMVELWFDIEPHERTSLYACRAVTGDDHIAIQFSNGQTVIVRAKK